MNTSASADFFIFDFTAFVSGNVFNAQDRSLGCPQSTQDADLLRQLSFVPGLKELLMLRQVHALEHATVWVLSELPHFHAATRAFNKVQIDNQLLSGLSTSEGFYLYGKVNISDLRRAVTLALHRLTSGEWDLAIHPRCGTNVSVSMLLTAGLAVGMHLLLPRGLIEQLIGLGLAATTASELAPDAGVFAQRYLTTAIPFNLAIENITFTHDDNGREAHFVKVYWQEKK